MVSFEKALEIIMHAVCHCDSEIVELEHSLGRVLARDILSDVNIPPADMSAMDGYACIFCDRSMPLKIVETIAAGTVPTVSIESGMCSRIMTGAMVPSGADCVVMFEHCSEIDGTVIVTKMTNNKNIRYKAEDANAGDVLLSKGTRIDAAICAVLAAAGCKNVPVVKLPRIAIIATGNELVEPEQLPVDAQIRNSNSYQLYAQALRCGCKPVYLGIAKDTKSSTQTLLQKAMSESDVILVSGGVSAGDFDFVPDTLKECGFNLLIESIAIKPGKPTVFGTNGKQFVFGMPGNPVSTFVLFEILVRPFLMRMMGNFDVPVFVKVPLANDLKKKKGDRKEIVPVRFTSEGFAEVVKYHGSAHINAYSKAHAFLWLNEDVDVVEKGTMVSVQLIEK
jgi:molybdopterin molybdotransferase